MQNENSPTLGSIQSTDAEKRAFCRRSRDFNLRDKVFCDLFSELADVRLRFSSELKVEGPFIITVVSCSNPMIKWQFFPSLCNPVYSTSAVCQRVVVYGRHPKFCHEQPRTTASSQPSILEQLRSGSARRVLAFHSATDPLNKTAASLDYPYAVSVSNAVSRSTGVDPIRSATLIFPRFFFRNFGRNSQGKLLPKLKVRPVRRKRTRRIGER